MSSIVYLPDNLAIAKSTHALVHPEHLETLYLYLTLPLHQKHVSPELLKHELMPVVYALRELTEEILEIKRPEELIDLSLTDIWAIADTKSTKALYITQNTIAEPSKRPLSPITQALEHLCLYASEEPQKLSNVHNVTFNSSAFYYGLYRVLKRLTTQSIQSNIYLNFVA